MRSAALSLAAAAGIFAVSYLLQARDTAPAPPPAAAVGEPVVLGAPQTTHITERRPDPSATKGTEEDTPAAQARPAPPAATRVAREFLLRYSRWETGDANPDVEARLRSTTSPALWRLLTSSRGQPQGGAGVTRVELKSLIAGTVSPENAATIAANLRRGHSPTSLALVVTKTDGRWLVTSLGR